MLVNGEQNNNHSDSRKIANTFTTNFNDQPTLESELIWDRDNNV